MTDDGLREFYAKMMKECAAYEIYRVELMTEQLIGFPPYYTVENNGVITVYMNHDMLTMYQSDAYTGLLDFTD